MDCAERDARRDRATESERLRVLNNKKAHASHVAHVQRVPIVRVNIDTKSLGLGRSESNVVPIDCDLGRHVNCLAGLQASDVDRGHAVHGPIVISDR